ncbi:MAG: Cys-Gln thioester bond-forming surface protein [Clostridia bacterium]|nr:Cys-Gln thioester bond-forming surface protein [Clostridia bacterium]
MKKIKKLLIILSMIVTNVLFNFLGLTNSVYAVELGGDANLFKIADCEALLTYRGMPIVTTYVGYNDGENTYPAYCLNANLLGVGEIGSYDVQVNDFVTDIGLWRRVINGYPYKSLTELGCATEEEAFTATKQAIYCYIHGNNLNDYGPIGEAGERTLNALYQIVSNAENSGETKLVTTITVDKESSNWKEDELDKTYVSKTYTVDANADYKNFTISIENSGTTELPQSLKVTDLNNQEKSIFEKQEQFKILIPIKDLKEGGKFNINISSELNTKPVLYGLAPEESMQDYALTTLKYENVSNSIEDNYEKNDTKIIINKKDKESKKSLEGVKFSLLDENKKVVKKDLKTNKEGKITITNLVPGKYYLVETAALDGYIKNNKEIEIKIELNQTVTINVDNEKEVIKETPKISEKKLPVTGM